MSATLDANILVYASNQADPLNEPARELVERLARGPGLVYLFWPTVMGYLRIVTHPAILPRPLSLSDAIHNVEALLDRPNVRTAGELDGFWTTFRSLVDGGLRGNLVPDAHLAALMRQHGVRLIYTRDRDFRRFPGIASRDPFV
ncbi:MAG: TA system VapC family ribonuclease toxin [Candidatus Limnocylindrales bacterium]